MYAVYSEEVLRTHFAAMFDILKELPTEYLPVIARALKQPWERLASEAEAEPVLIPCKKRCCKDEDDE